MKYCVVLVLMVFVLMDASHFDHRAAVGFSVSPQVPAKLSSRCLGDEEVLRRLESISTGQTLSEQLSAQSQLVANAKKSSECRTRVITALVKAMDKPALDLQNDRPSFYLWHYGGEILASLKAAEALDLLIEHFELHDGTLFPLHHHPALINIIRMGSLAIPKLTTVLKENPNPNSRQYAVFCLAEIGGADAKSALQQALSSESNTCVRSFMGVTLQAFNNSTSGDHIEPETRTRWYATFVCDDAR